MMTSLSACSCSAPIFSGGLQVIAIAIPFSLGSLVGAAQAKPTIDWWDFYTFQLHGSCWTSAHSSCAAAGS